MTDGLSTIDTIRDDFAFLDDWEDRYRYVIDLGRGLPPLDADAYNDENKVRGCASQVWLKTEVRDRGGNAPVLCFKGDSDALIVKGLIAILFAVYSERPATEILNTDAEAIFNELGLKEHLTPQRSNGLASMVARVRADADTALNA